VHGVREEKVVYRFRLLTLLCLLTSTQAWADPPPGYPFLPFDEGVVRARKENKPLFIYFGRFGCAWCDEVNKKTFVDPQLKSLLTRHYVLVYVDAESGKRLRLPSGERITEADLGVRWRAFATPLFLYMLPDGTELVRVPGIQTVEDFLHYDRYVREGHYRSQTLTEFLRAAP
jgi:thioredoxin-related protein